MSSPRNRSRSSASMRTCSVTSSALIREGADVARVALRHQAEPRAVGIKAVEDRVKPDVFLAAEVHVEAWVLKDDAHSRANCARLTDDVEPGDPDPPRGWDQRGGEN